MSSIENIVNVPFKGNCKLFCLHWVNHLVHIPSLIKCRHLVVNIFPTENAVMTY